MRTIAKGWTESERVSELIAECKCRRVESFFVAPLTQGGQQLPRGGGRVGSEGVGLSAGGTPDVLRLKWWVGSNNRTREGAWESRTGERAGGRGEESF